MMNTGTAPGWRLAGNNVEFFVTRTGAQLAPAVFRLPSGRTVEPYYLSPWQFESRPEITDPVLKSMRGDFFCLPFGGNAEEVDGERHPGHGETAGSDWTLAAETDAALTLEIRPRVRPGLVRRTIALHGEDTALYLRHELTGFHGAMPLGSHPILQMPEEGETMYLCSSKFRLGLTRPGVFSDPAQREYQQLAAGELFTELTALPLASRYPATADYSVFPPRRGFADLFCLLKRREDGPAWMAAVYPERGYLWFALKNVEQLPATAIWTSNSGRYHPPWNGDVRCFGVEEICGAFDFGLKASLEENLISRAGFPTAIELDGGVEVRLIEGVAELPAGFGRALAADFQTDRIDFIDGAGLRATARVRPGFLRGECL